jgi:hypothetical protein
MCIMPREPPRHAPTAIIRARRRSRSRYAQRNERGSGLSYSLNERLLLRANSPNVAAKTLPSLARQ